MDTSNGLSTNIKLCMLRYRLTVYTNKHFCKYQLKKTYVDLGLNEDEKNFVQPFKKDFHGENEI